MLDIWRYALWLTLLWGEWHHCRKLESVAILQIMSHGGPRLVNLLLLHHVIVLLHLIAAIINRRLLLKRRDVKVVLALRWCHADCVCQDTWINLTVVFVRSIRGVSPYSIEILLFKLLICKSGSSLGYYVEHCLWGWLQILCLFFFECIDQVIHWTNIGRFACIKVLIHFDRLTFSLA